MRFDKIEDKALVYYLILVKNKTGSQKKGTLRIVPNPITDTNTRVEHKTLGAIFGKWNSPRALAELGTAGFLTEELVLWEARLARTTTPCRYP